MKLVWMLAVSMLLLSPAAFADTFFFPLVVDGAFADGSFYRSTILIINDSTQRIICEVRPSAGITSVTFSRRDGTALMGSTFAVPAFGFEVLRTTVANTFNSGYLELSCPTPGISAQIVYSLNDRFGNKLAEAPVFPIDFRSANQTILHGIVDHRFGQRLGLALANSDNRATKIRVTVMNTGGAIVKESVLNINPRVTITGFVDELVPGLPPDLVGKVVIRPETIVDPAVRATGLQFTGNTFTTVPLSYCGIFFSPTGPAECMEK